MRRRHVQHLHDFIREVDLFAGREERVVRPDAVRHARRLALQAAHAVQHLLVRDYGCPFEARRFPSTRAPDPGVDVPSRVREVLVAARVMLVGAGVDDLANRLVGDGPDCGQYLVAHRGRARVDEEQSVGVHLHADIRA